MKRIILIIVWGLLAGGWPAVPCLWAQCRPGTADRDVWVKTLVRLVDPVLSNLANETLKKRMPYQSLAPDRQRFSYLEAVGRTVCGMAPGWNWERTIRRKTVTQEIHRADCKRNQQCR